MVITPLNPPFLVDRPMTIAWNRDLSDTGFDQFTMEVTFRPDSTRGHQVIAVNATSGLTNGRLTYVLPIPGPWEVQVNGQGPVTPGTGTGDLPTIRQQFNVIDPTNSTTATTGADVQPPETSPPGETALAKSIPTSNQTGSPSNPTGITPTTPASLSPIPDSNTTKPSTKTSQEPANSGAIVKTPMIVGIVVGVVVVLAALIILAVFLVKRRRRQRLENTVDAFAEPSFTSNNGNGPMVATDGGPISAPLYSGYGHVSTAFSASTASRTSYGTSSQPYPSSLPYSASAAAPISPNSTYYQQSQPTTYSSVSDVKNPNIYSEDYSASSSTNSSTRALLPSQSTSSSTPPSSFPSASMAQLSPETLAILSRRNSNRNSVSSQLTSRQLDIRSRAAATLQQVSALESLLARNNANVLPDTSEVQDAYAELARLRAGMERLVELEESDWARGLVDAPPPSYNQLN